MRILHASIVHPLADSVTGGTPAAGPALPRRYSGYDTGVLWLLLYLLLAILIWISFWAFLFFYSATSLCPQCGGELESRFSFARGQGIYCRRCWYER
jgi:hypothetical protein